MVKGLVRLLAALCVQGAQSRGSAAAFSFSGVFSDGAVLQRATAAAPNTQAAVFGSGAAPGSKVTIRLTGTGGGALPGEAVAEETEGTASADGSWKVLLAPKPAGGDFTVSATSQGLTVALTSVTFGDVWLCAGQSNMELNMHFTFEKNDTYAAVGAGKYKNIRCALTWRRASVAMAAYVGCQKGDRVAIRQHRTPLCVFTASVRR